MSLRCALKKVSANVLLVTTMIGMSYTVSIYASEVTHHESALHNNAVIRIFLEEGLSIDNISVNAKEQTLQVIGFVDSKSEMRKLAKVLDKYKEHDRVINNVKILSIHNNKSDEKSLKSNVIQALSDNKFNAKDISVEVRNGHVILGGFIDRHIDANLVGQTAQNVPGVTNLDNYVLYKS